MTTAPDGASRMRVVFSKRDPTRLHENTHPGFFGSTGWGDAITVIPWTLYLHYGDPSVLVETLPAMERWADFEWSISDGPIVNR